MLPAGSTNAQLLILGSLSGEVSLEVQRYYAHPRNQFWSLLGEVLGVELASIPYDDRLTVLAERRIALWDVVGEARRQGSLDGSIRDAVANDLAEYVKSHPRLRAVAFNGKTAARLGRSALSDLKGVEMIDLPSSSPAYTIAFADKLAKWSVIGPLACRAEVATVER